MCKKERTKSNFEGFDRGPILTPLVNVEGLLLIQEH